MRLESAWERALLGVKDNDGKSARGEVGERLNVMLIYEDFTTGLRARQAFEQIGCELDLDADFSVDLWKFDLLRQPALLERAATVAAESDIVILSAHGRDELPGTADIWLEQWFDRRSGEPCALVVLLDKLAEDTLTPNQPFWALRTAALAAGVDVFFHASEALQTERPSALDEIRPQPESREGFSDEIIHRLERHPYRHWGINE
jgi:hypothetical protein